MNTSKITYFINSNINLITTYRVRVVAAMNGTNPTDRHFTALSSTGEYVFAGTKFTVLLYFPNHLHCINRFFRHGGKCNSRLCNDLLAPSLIILTICFKLSLFPTKILGSSRNDRSYWLVLLAISNSLAKLRSMK